MKVRMKIGMKIFIISFHFILIIIKNESDLENQLFRFIKYNIKNINIDYNDEQILSIIRKVKSFKEKKYKIISYNKIKEPKVAFISPVFNQINYLYFFISSVQNQKLKEYELIFVDDFSTDDSYKFLLEQQKIDGRIKLISNKKNRGALYSRYIGQKLANAKFSIFLDCDDIVLEHGIFQSYNHIIKYNLDIIQFHTIRQTQDSIFLKTNCYKYNRIIYKPILPYIFYYDYKLRKGNEQNSALWDKLVRTTIMNKAFEFIGSSYLKKNIIINNDVIVLFAIFQIANSYQYINTIGYFYIRNNEKSTINSWKDPKKREKIIKSFLINVKFLFEKTKDTYLDKLYCIYRIQNYFKSYKQLFINLNNSDYYYLKNIIDKMINLKYLPIQDKLSLTKIELFVLNMK